MCRVIIVIRLDIIAVGLSGQRSARMGGAGDGVVEFLREFLRAHPNLYFITLFTKVKR